MKKRCNDVIKLCNCVIRCDSNLSTISHLAANVFIFCDSGCSGDSGCSTTVENSPQGLGVMNSNPKGFFVKSIHLLMFSFNRSLGKVQHHLFSYPKLDA